MVLLIIDLIKYPMRLKYLMRLQLNSLKGNSIINELKTGMLTVFPRGSIHWVILKTLLSLSSKHKFG